MSVTTALSTKSCLNIKRQRGNKSFCSPENKKRGIECDCGAGDHYFAILPHQLPHTGVRKEKMLRKLTPVWWNLSGVT